MRGTTAGLGHDNFYEVINKNNLYFDKTLLIKDLIESNNIINPVYKT